MTDAWRRLLGSLAVAGGLAGMAVALAACGANGENTAANDLGSGGAYPGANGTGASTSISGGTTSVGSGGSGNAGNVAGTAGTGAEPPPPPEKELESAFQAPVATHRYVWAANPTTGRVALIGADDFSVRLAEAGLAPTTVAALPGSADEDAAIVLNAGSNDATILRLGADGSVRPTTLPTHAGANSVTVSPSGGYAVVWTDAAKLDAAQLDSTDGLQDVTVVRFTDPPVATVLSVGYRPSQVAFDAKEKRAFVVTEPGLSVLALGDAPAAESLVDLTADPVAENSARDVTVTPDGRHAVVRVDGTRTLGFVDLDAGSLQTVTLGDYVTDLDLSADGKLAFAVAGGELVAVPIPPPPGATEADFAHASTVGLAARSVSLSPDASLALLYSNGANTPYVGILSSATPPDGYAGRAVDVKAPVLAAFAAPDGRHGIAFQQTAATSTKGGAFSVVSTQEDRAPKIVGTDAAPMAVAFSPEGAQAVIATRDLVKRKYGVYLVTLESYQQSFVELSSPPLAAGIVPDARRAFVAQAHPEGRITFIDLDTGSEHTLTGFELAAKVMQ